MQHGFPHRASALAWDPLLRVVALGTATGALKVYGRPGVELYGQHTNSDSSVTQIHFIPGKFNHLFLVNISTMLERPFSSLYLADGLGIAVNTENVVKAAPPNWMVSDSI